MRFNEIQSVSLNKHEWCQWKKIITLILRKIRDSLFGAFLVTMLKDTDLAYLQIYVPI